MRLGMWKGAHGSRTREDHDKLEKGRLGGGGGGGEGEDYEHL